MELEASTNWAIAALVGFVVLVFILIFLVPDDEDPTDTTDV